MSQELLSGFYIQAYETTVEVLARRIDRIWLLLSWESGRPEPATCRWIPTIPPTRRQQILADARPLLVLDDPTRFGPSRPDAPPASKDPRRIAYANLHLWLHRHTQGSFDRTRVPCQLNRLARAPVRGNGQRPLAGIDPITSSRSTTMHFRAHLGKAGSKTG